MAVAETSKVSAHATVRYCPQLSTLRVTTSSGAVKPSDTLGVTSPVSSSVTASLAVKVTVTSLNGAKFT